MSRNQAAFLPRTLVLVPLPSADLARVTVIGTPAAASECEGQSGERASTTKMSRHPKSQRIVPGAGRSRNSEMLDGKALAATRRKNADLLLTTLPEGFLTVRRWLSRGYPPTR